MIRFVVVDGVSRKRRNRHPAPFLDASTAVLARASASRRAAATAGIPVARSPTCAPAAANLASCSRSRDVDSCVSCVSFPPAVSFPPVATASVTAAASVAVGGSLVGGTTPRLAKDAAGGVLDAASRDAGGRERSPDVFRVASCLSRVPVAVLLVLVGSPSSSSAGEHRFLRRQLRFPRRLDRRGRRRPRGGVGADPARRVRLSRASACAPAGGGVRARAAADARGAAVASFARLRSAWLLARVLGRAGGDFAARRVVARRRRRRRSVVGRNDDDLLGGFARAPRAVAAVAVGKHHRLDGVERVRAHAFFDGSTASCGRERRRRRVSNLDGRGIRPRETRHRERMSEGIFYKLDRKYWYDTCAVVHARDGDATISTSPPRAG